MPSGMGVPPPSRLHEKKKKMEQETKGMGH